MTRARIPKFGSWDSNDGTPAPFTRVFEDARAGRTGKVINPNDPAEYQEAAAARQQRKTEPPVSHASKDEADSDNLFRNYPANRVQVDDSRYVPQAGVNGTALRGTADNATRRVGYNQGNSEGVSVGGEREQSDTAHHVRGPARSPLHNQARLGGSKTGSASPAWERRASTDGSGGSATPGRSRLRTGNPNAVDAAEKGAAALPKFGAWDVNDPASADGFTVIFNNARNEKKAGGAVHVPQLGSDGQGDKDLYPGGGKQTSLQTKSSKKYFCCFGD